AMPTLAPTRTIDVRELQGPNHCQTVLAAFDSLASGETLVVVSDHEPRKLLRHLQADRKGEFEWSPLEQGPQRFRTELTRRAAARGSLRAVNEALAWDHDRLEAIEARAFRLYAEGDRAGAREAWPGSERGRRRHIRCEEEILFPASESGTGAPAGRGPVPVMKLEHRRIERLLEDIGRALAGGGAPLPLRVELHLVLGEHNAKEEGVLYPMTDGCLGPEGSDALVTRSQAS